jgi:hypothetical protein
MPTVHATTTTCKHHLYPLSLPGEAQPVSSSLILVASHTKSPVCSAAPCDVCHCRRVAGSCTIKSSYSCANLAIDQSFTREPAAKERGVAEVPPSATEVLPVAASSGLCPTWPAPPRARPWLHDALRTWSRPPRPRYRAAANKSPPT